MLIDLISITEQQPGARRCARLWRQVYGFPSSPPDSPMFNLCEPPCPRDTGRDTTAHDRGIGHLHVSVPLSLCMTFDRWPLSALQTSLSFCLQSTLPSNFPGASLLHLIRSGDPFLSPYSFPTSAHQSYPWPSVHPRPHTCTPSTMALITTTPENSQARPLCSQKSVCRTDSLACPSRPVWAKGK